MLKEIQDCFRAERLYYTGYAKDEMEAEEFGEIRDKEVSEAVSEGKIIETYPEDSLAIIITAYQPLPEQWIDFTRRKK